jgi:ribosomal peptide maturation radical SAM protein 1
MDGISAKIYYFNLKLAERVGLELYDRLSETSLDSPLIGELAFSSFVFDTFRRNKHDIRLALTEIFTSKGRHIPYLEKIVNEVISVMELIPEFLDDCIYNVLADKPEIVGFTSTFEQNCASLALAKLLKRYDHSIPVIFGGANCEGTMGSTLLRCIPWVDFICSGEGDIAFLDFIRYFIAGEHSRRVNGILTRESNFLETNLTNPVMDMDSLPFPDYDDFFLTFRNSHLLNELEPELVIETSRGCWWGEKFQCTFCGLNGSTMTFRSKSVEHVLREIKHLCSRYRIKKFQIVDNILDLEYFNSLFPKLKEEKLGVELFYEIKSNISKDQLRVLKNGGVQAIQPGVESFSDDVLELMKKGVTGLRNIQLLKWCREIRILPNWNFLWGFPKEPKAEYERMATLIPKVVHLYPPTGFGRIVLDRFSPYFVEPEKNGIRNVRPWSAYKYLYPFRNEDLSTIAYHFDFDYGDDRDPESYTKELEQQLLLWKNLWDGKKRSLPPPALSEIISGKIVLIKDTRPSSKQAFHLLANEEAEIYKLCDSVHSFHAIALNIRNSNKSFTEETIRDILISLLERDLMIKAGNNFLSLAVQIQANHNKSGSKL